MTQQQAPQNQAASHQKAMQALIEIMSQDQGVEYLYSMRFALSLASQYLQMPLGVICHIENDHYVIEAYHLQDGVDLSVDEMHERAVKPIASSPYARLQQTEKVVAIETIVNGDNGNADEQVFASSIGVTLTMNEQCVGGLMFYDLAAREIAFSVAEKEFVHGLGQWIQKALHQSQLNKQLTISNERFTLALNGGQLGLWDLDLTSGKLALNERWGQMLGYELSDFNHSSEIWRRLMHPDDIRLAYGDLKSHLKDKSAEIDHSFRMKHKNGHWIWVHNRGKVVERDINQKPTRIMGTHMDVSAIKIAEEEIKQLAFYDVLTTLPNRRLLLDRLDHAIVNSARNRTHGALIFVDLDDFKSLNETLGHDKGDTILKNVASRLSGCLRDGDTVARFGGDEFVVMLDKLDIDAEIAMQQVEKVGDKIIESLNQPHNLVGMHYHSKPTLGATIFNGVTDRIEDSLKRADIAMFQAKNAGKKTLHFFDQYIQTNLLNKTKLEADLRVGIAKGQFELHYQPQIDRVGKISGAEALLRWVHPERGNVSPLDFIPLAEETGLIIELGDWVVKMGCKQLAEWGKNPITAHHHLSINVSARQFQQPDFVDQVIKTLVETGASPNKLKLELTESMLVDDVDDVITKMSQLRVKGVSFSLDDFGTGFSSLSFLKLLPLNELKIDKSFVRDVLTDNNDAVIARTIVALANSLGLSVIAEGVELEGQREFLAQNGCHDYQGYLFSRPLSIEHYNQLCREYKPPAISQKIDPLQDSFPLI